MDTDLMETFKSLILASLLHLHYLWFVVPSPCYANEEKGLSKPNMLRRKFLLDTCASHTAAGCGPFSSLSSAIASMSSSPSSGSIHLYHTSISLMLCVAIAACYLQLCLIWLQLRAQL